MPTHCPHSRRNPLSRSVPVLCAVLATFARCALSQGELNRHYPVTDPTNFTRVVASVGDIRITAQEFLLSYEFGPAFTKRQKDSRKRYLDFMINEKLLALDARSRGLLKSPRVTKPLEELEGDMATEELFRDDVLSRVSVSNREIAEGMREANVHYAIRWIYTSAAGAASSLGGALRAGVPFDTLWARQLAGAVKKDDRAMATTLFGLRRASPLLARVADTLRQGEYSAPVQGPDGWYVVRVDSGWRDITLSATESAKRQDEVRRALTEEKSDSLSGRYVRKLMLSRNPVIIRETFNVLESWLMRIWVRPDRYAAWDIAARLAGDSAAAASRVNASGHDTLVSLSSGCIRLGEFLSWYRARDTYFSLKSESEPSFFVSVEDLVWRMVRDRLLVERALARSLQDRDPVKKQLRWWEDKLLFGEEKAYLGSTVDLSDTALRAFYEANTRQYRSDSGAVQNFERVKESVRSDCFAFGLKKNMLHATLALKQKYRVAVNEAVLTSLPVDIENDPKAIDVYIAKKGGTFPHPAFPVIDLLWQTWM